MGGGVPLGAVPALSWCGEVSLEGKQIIIVLLAQPLATGRGATAALDLSAGRVPLGVYLIK